MIYELEILGELFVVEYSATITSQPYRGRGADLHQPGEPPEPGEFEVDLEMLYRKGRSRPDRTLDAPDWLQDLIEAQIIEDDTVYREVFDNAQRGPDPDPDTVYEERREARLASSLWD